MSEFVPFDKIPRLRRGCTITEKIDGTNAQVYFADDGSMLVGSRNRWITPDADNYGFARWAYENEAELRKLGPGRHFGEWWGAGIQRRYGVPDKRFSLFNVGRWGDGLPADVVGLVPVLYAGDFTDTAVNDALHRLSTLGSAAAPGFRDPEGIVVHHAAANRLFKVTLGSDGHKEARVA
jgi:hypothetical protein